jgi:hypothetical protein
MATEKSYLNEGSQNDDLQGVPISERTSHEPQPEGDGLPELRDFGVCGASGMALFRLAAAD